MSLATPIRADELKPAFEQEYPDLVKIDFPMIVIGSVSGVGRSSVGRELQKQMGEGVKAMRHFTTRSERGSGGDDRLVFGTMEEYEKKVAEGDVLVSTYWEPNNNYYVLINSEVDRVRGAEKVVFETTHFCWALKSQAPHLVKVVWLTCEDENNIRTRIGDRGSEKIEENENRIKSAISEQKYILNNKNKLLSRGKIDLIINTDEKSVKEIVNQVLDGIVE